MSRCSFFQRHKDASNNVKYKNLKSIPLLVDMFLLKVNNGNTKTRSKICLNLKIKIPE